MEVCFSCLATRGNHCFDLVYTDVAATAGWRGTENTLEPWLFPPPFARLHGFHKRMLQVDFMHTWHLGVAQDLVGSACKLLCRARGVYQESTIAKRLNQLYAEVKAWAKLHGKQLALKRLRRHTLNWSKGCPVLKAKAADSVIFLQYLNEKLQAHPPALGGYGGLVAVVWAATELAGCVMSAETFLSPHEKHHIEVVGQTFLSVYASLAHEAVSKHEYYFKMRPKLHYLQHMLEDDRPSRRSPGWDNCFIFEDHIKQCIKMLRKCSHRTAERQLLRRNAIALKQYKHKHLLGSKMMFHIRQCLGQISTVSPGPLNF